MWLFCLFSFIDAALHWNFIFCKTSWLYMYKKENFPLYSLLFQFLFLQCTRKDVRIWRNVLKKKPQSYNNIQYTKAGRSLRLIFILIFPFFACMHVCVCVHTQHYVLTKSFIFLLLLKNLCLHAQHAQSMQIKGKRLDQQILTTTTGKYITNDCLWFICTYFVYTRQRRREGGRERDDTFYRKNTIQNLESSSYEF